MKKFQNIIDYFKEDRRNINMLKEISLKNYPQIDGCIGKRCNTYSDMYDEVFNAIHKIYIDKIKEYEKNNICNEKIKKYIIKEQFKIENIVSVFNMNKDEHTIIEKILGACIPILMFGFGAMFKTLKENNNVSIDLISYITISILIIVGISSVLNEIIVYDFNTKRKNYIIFNKIKLQVLRNINENIN